MRPALMLAVLWALALPSGALAAETAQPLAIGSEHVCAVGAQQVQCAGSNFSGQIGDGTTSPTSPGAAVRLPTGVHPVAVSAGWWHTCALTAEQRVFCWGGNLDGQTGRSDAELEPLPVEVEVPGQRIIDVGAAGNVTCLLTASRELWCLGANEAGQLGQGHTSWDGGDIAIQPTGMPRPLRVPLPGPVARFDPGSRSSCAILSDGSTYCWGYWTADPSLAPLVEVRNDKVPTTPVTRMTAPDGEAVRRTASTGETICLLTSTVWCRGGRAVSRGFVTPVALPDSYDTPPPFETINPPRVPWNEITQVKGITAPVDLVGYAERFCVLGGAGGSEAQCWGLDARSTGQRTSYTGIPFGVTVTAGLAPASALVRGGSLKTCVLEPGNPSAVCWGVLQTGGNLERAASTPATVTQRSDTPLVAAPLPLPAVPGGAAALTDVTLTGDDRLGDAAKRGGPFTADPRADVRLTATALRAQRLTVTLAARHGKRFRKMRGRATLRTRGGSVTRAVTGRWAGRRLPRGTYRYTVRPKRGPARSVSIAVR